MIRGTTPQLKFDLPFSVEELDVFYVTFQQNKQTVIEKRKGQCTCEGNTIALHLTQIDTLALLDKFPVEIQIRARKGDEAIASNIITTNVGRILKDGEI